jgi:hypothetical protein
MDYVIVENDTVWLTQQQMGQLFGKDRRTVNEHIGNIFKEGELEEEVVSNHIIVYGFVF